jgi:hypothetical protein
MVTHRLLHRAPFENSDPCREVKSLDGHDPAITTHTALTTGPRAWHPLLIVHGLIPPL